MTVTLYALVMIFGMLVAGAGLALLFTRHEQGQNRIKLFGQEFQISTPALVVFLAGCAMFIMPLVLQIKDRDLIVLGSGSNGQHSNANHKLIEGEEKEPNDNASSANLISIGTVIRGVIVTTEDRDFYKFQVPAKAGAAAPKIRVIVHKMFNVGVVIYNENEERGASQDMLGEDPISFVFVPIPGASYYAVVKSQYNGRGSYDLVLREE